MPPLRKEGTACNNGVHGALHQEFSMVVKLASWNVNGIRAVMRKEQLHPFLAALEPDIVCLQETKAQQQDVDLALDGYEISWNAAEKKGYSGTAIFSRMSLGETVKNFPEDVVEKYGVTGDAYGNPNNEGRIIAAEYPAFLLVTVYTPNVKEDLSRLPLRAKQWDPAFTAYVRRLQERKPVIICGDLNVAHMPDDLANPAANAGKKGFTDEEREGFETLVDAGFVDTFRMFHQGNGYYTWWAPFAKSRERNIGWRIDYFLVSESLREMVVAADIHPSLLGSDHCPVSLTLEIP